MSISGDYPHPVQVNGFTCRNCTDVDYARKHVDPAHPKVGPYGIDAGADPGLKARADSGAARAVTLGGQLAKSQSDNRAATGGNAGVTTEALSAPGRSVNILT